MKEHPSDKDLLKEGTTTRADLKTTLKTLVPRLLADLRTMAQALWHRLRR